MNKLNGIFAALALTLAATSATAGDDHVRRAPETGNAIAAQGNAALAQIRNEAMRLPQPTLAGVQRAPDAESLAQAAQDLEPVRYRARIAALRPDVFKVRKVARN